MIELALPALLDMGSANVVMASGVAACEIMRAKIWPDAAIASGHIIYRVRTSGKVHAVVKVCLLNSQML